MASDPNSMKENIYKDIVLQQVPRILSLGDRDSRSKTFGCFDRYYWHYKIIDFPNARFQEVCLLLSLLFKYSYTGNVYAGNKQILNWALAAIEFWKKIQNRDGSFNEVYPNEHSFVATAFSTYTVTESMMLLDKRDLASLDRAGMWLSKNDNFRVSNQVAASISALYNIYLLTGDEKYREASQKKLETLMASCRKNGFFPEYGGFDIGYSTIGLSFLYDYARKAKHDELKDLLDGSIDMINRSLARDGTYDCEKMSRKTQYVYPYALASSRIIEPAAKHQNGLYHNRVINPAWVDDRFCIPLTINYLQTYLLYAQDIK